MIEADAEKVIDKYLRPFKAALYLNDWTTNIKFERITKAGSISNEQVIAHCEPDPSYMRATLTFDPELHSDEEQLATSLLHELLHIYHADFEVFRRQLGQLLGDQQFDTLDVMFSHCCERLVYRLESLLRLGLNMEFGDIQKVGAQFIESVEPQSTPPVQKPPKKHRKKSKKKAERRVDPQDEF